MPSSNVRPRRRSLAVSTYSPTARRRQRLLLEDELEHLVVEGPRLALDVRLVGSDRLQPLQFAHDGVEDLTLPRRLAAECRRAAGGGRPAQVGVLLDQR